MKRWRRWTDGLRTRIALALLAALLIQFVGGEIIFTRMETARGERVRSVRLAARLATVEQLVVARGGEVDLALLNALWKPDMQFARLPAVAPPPPEGPEAAEIRSTMVAIRPELGQDGLRIVRVGKEWLEGRMRLENGSWLAFRSEWRTVRETSLLSHYLASVLLLLACVALIALLFGRMIGRPLRQLVAAAENAGRGEPATIAIDGPREVRQVAAAFDAMQARLLDHVRDRVQSLAAMSHDLRTPLARLRLNASTLDDPEARAAIEADVAEMEAFVTSLLDYLRGDEAEAEQLSDISSIVMTVVDDARDRGEDVAFSGPERLERVTKPLKLKRLVRNIVQNAVRHAGDARVGLRVEGDDVVITVDDRGPGIPEDALDRVFEPFSRVETSRNRETGGAGLGLAIARQLATRLGGSIMLRNRPQGGLRVTIRLSGLGAIDR